MPLIYESSYTKRPRLHFNSYLETVLPFLTTRIYQVDYKRERLELPDGDFLDLDWMKQGSSKLMLLTHGFEGNTRDPYMEQSASFFSQQGFDILLWNLRSCSGELNRLPRFYHHGDADDLSQVIDHAVHSGAYDEIILVGFSLGGAISLSFLARNMSGSPISGAIVLSVPLDVAKTSERIRKRWNKLLLEKNFGKIKTKVLQKAEQFPDLIDVNQVAAISNLNDLNQEVLLSLNGFSSLESYYHQWNALQFLPEIKLPTLIINAQNDPLLSENDFPYELCEKSEWEYLETPRYGGHVGFAKNVKGKHWYLTRMQEFIETHIS